MFFRLLPLLVLLLLLLLVALAVAKEKGWPKRASTVVITGEEKRRHHLLLLLLLLLRLLLLLLLLLIKYRKVYGIIVHHQSIGHHWVAKGRRTVVVVVAVVWCHHPPLSYYHVNYNYVVGYYCNEARAGEKKLRRIRRMDNNEDCFEPRILHSCVEWMNKSSLLGGERCSCNVHVLLPTENRDVRFGMWLHGDTDGRMRHMYAMLDGNNLNKQNNGKRARSKVNNDNNKKTQE